MFDENAPQPAHPIPDDGWCHVPCDVLQTCQNDLLLDEQINARVDNVPKAYIRQVGRPSEGWIGSAACSYKELWGRAGFERIGFLNDLFYGPELYRRTGRDVALGHRK